VCFPELEFLFLLFLFFHPVCRLAAEAHISLVHSETSTVCGYKELTTVTWEKLKDNNVVEKKKIEKPC
jgi:hypothetical protein